MSNNDHDITTSFIQMVEAFKAKPELEAKVADLTADNDLCYKTIQMKADRIAILEAELDAKAKALEEVKKEADDATFRNLEFEEKFSGLEKLLGMAEKLEAARKETLAKVEADAKAKDEEEKAREAERYLAEHPPIVEAAPIPETPPVPFVPSILVEDGTGTNSVDEIGVSISSELNRTRINPYSGEHVTYPNAGAYVGKSYWEKPDYLSWLDFVDEGGEPQPFMKTAEWN